MNPDEFQRFLDALGEPVTKETFGQYINIVLYELLCRQVQAVNKTELPKAYKKTFIVSGLIHSIQKALSPKDSDTEKETKKLIGYLHGDLPAVTEPGFLDRYINCCADFLFSSANVNLFDGIPVPSPSNARICLELRLYFWKNLKKDDQKDVSSFLKGLPDKNSEDYPMLKGKRTEWTSEDIKRDICLKEDFCLPYQKHILTPLQTWEKQLTTDIARLAVTRQKPGICSHELMKEEFENACSEEEIEAFCSSDENFLNFFRCLFTDPLGIEDGKSLADDYYTLKQKSSQWKNVRFPTYFRRVRQTAKEQLSEKDADTLRRIEIDYYNFLNLDPDSREILRLAAALYRQMLTDKTEEQANQMFAEQLTKWKTDFEARLSLQALSNRLDKEKEPMFKIIQFKNRLLPPGALVSHVQQDGSILSGIPHIDLDKMDWESFKDYCMCHYLTYNETLRTNAVTAAFLYTALHEGKKNKSKAEQFKTVLTESIVLKSVRELMDIVDPESPEPASDELRAEFFHLLFP